MMDAIGERDVGIDKNGTENLFFSEQNVRAKNGEVDPEE